MPATVTYDPNQAILCYTNANLNLSARSRRGVFILEQDSLMALLQGTLTLANFRGRLDSIMITEALRTITTVAAAAVGSTAVAAAPTTPAAAAAAATVI